MCDQGYRGKTCEKNNPCEPNPCQHNGRCTDFNGTPTCECEDRFTGDKCQRDNCANCADHALCVNGHCECEQGFEGNGETECKKNIPQHTNPCENNLCENGATCNPDIDNTGYTCRCPEGFEGRYCQDRIPGSHADPCANNPCVNGGTCIVVNEGFQCNCLPGYRGQRCEDKASSQYEPTVCHPNPCLNGGSCKENGNGFDCICEIQYTGSLCEVDKCAKCDAHAKCVNGHCRCRTGWIGNGYECVKDEGCGGKCGIMADCVTHICQCQQGYTGNGYTCAPGASSAQSSPAVVPTCGVCPTGAECMPSGTCGYPVTAHKRSTGT